MRWEVHFWELEGGSWEFKRLSAEKKTRLDRLLVERGLAPTRERARALILAGQVRVDGHPAPKAGLAVASDADVALVTADHPYVGRGGVKLAHALEAFDIAVEGRTAWDIGASTGGFTDVLLRRGARRVVAADVGRNQLDWRLRSDPRVEVHEGINIRHLQPGAMPGPFDVVAIDVSFISLAHILPVVPPRLAASADVVALVKPQFEAGRDAVGPGGLVLDADVHAAVLDAVKTMARAVGLTAIAMTPSPITGVAGNQEFFLHLQVGA